MGDPYDEYFYKDHLGNVRQVIRAPFTLAFRATMEEEKAQEEEQLFDQLPETRILDHRHNNTPGGNQVAWLNADRGRLLGPSRSQEVQEGDSLTLEVDVIFDRKPKGLLHPSALVRSGSEKLWKDRLLEGVQNLNFSPEINPFLIYEFTRLLLAEIESKKTPESYLMYALYDQDSVLYDRGKVLVSNAAANEHEQLRQTLKVKKNGYLETFVVNETAQNIFFDNLKVQSTSPIIVQENAYYPFGMAIAGLDYSYNNHTNRYLYNGKELIEDLNLGLYDYGARFYDPVIGRWISFDPLTHLYPGISPYAYVANNPINAIDPDGRLIIFINGMHTGDGGKKRYWNGLDTRIMNRVGDHHARYYDGSMGGAWNTASRGILTGNNLIPGNRRRAGKSMGFNQAAEIFNSLGDGESIKIATHSMGAAYGKGFIQGLRKYAKKNNIDIADLIEFEVDLAPFQPTQQEAQEGVPTTVVAHEGDPVAGSSPMPGADNNVTRKGKKKSLSEHSVDSFDQREIDQFVPQSTRNRSGTSTWEQKPDKKND